MRGRENERDLEREEQGCACHSNSWEVFSYQHLGKKYDARQRDGYYLDISSCRHDSFRHV